MEIKDLHEKFLQCNAISIDTRKINSGSFFVAIKGTQFDANSFAAEALTKGALFVVIDNPQYYIDERTILVDNSLETLQQLAKYHRQYLKIPIIALTGSNGKTTTKELINAVVSSQFNTKATLGNLNNHIGVPLTLLSFTTKTQIGIVEMGANHVNEIAFLCSIALPDYGYITNFGKAHLEGFGGVEGVIKGKSELYQFLKNNNKTAVVNLDDSLQVLNASGINPITFGLKKNLASTNITAIQAKPFVSISFDGTTINSHLIGLYNANNIQAAVAIGQYLGISNDKIKAAIEAYIPENNRSQLLKKGTNDIILDAYNANPSSMTVAIDNFLQLDKKPKLMILGDMFELGNESYLEHQALIQKLDKHHDIACIFVGKSFFEAKMEQKNRHFFETFDQLKNYLQNVTLQDNIILIKGSRGMALERCLDYIS